MMMRIYRCLKEPANFAVQSHRPLFLGPTADWMSWMYGRVDGRYLNGWWMTLQADQADTDVVNVGHSHREVWTTLILMDLHHSQLRNGEQKNQGRDRLECGWVVEIETGQWHSQSQTPWRQFFISLTPPINHQWKKRNKSKWLEWISQQEALLVVLLKKSFQKKILSCGAVFAALSHFSRADHFAHCRPFPPKPRGSSRHKGLGVEAAGISCFLECSLDKSGAKSRTIVRSKICQHLTTSMI